MAKIKTKKQKATFSESITSIFEAHGISLDDDIRLPLIEDIQTYFNDVFRPDDTVKWFSELVSQYMKMFEEITQGEKSEFNPVMGINLKRLTKVLMRRHLELSPQGIWDLNQCLTSHEKFYRLAITIPWIKQNFTPTMLYSKYNEIIATLSQKRIQQQKIDEKILSN